MLGIPNHSLNGARRSGRTVALSSAATRDTAEGGSVFVVSIVSGPGIRVIPRQNGELTGYWRCAGDGLDLSLRQRLASIAGIPAAVVAVAAHAVGLNLGSSPRIRRMNAGESKQSVSRPLARFRGLCASVPSQVKPGSQLAGL